jgi:hypothetical protein
VPLSFIRGRFVQVRARLELIQERPLDLLDVDAAIDRLDRISDLHYVFEYL